VTDTVTVPDDLAGLSGKSLLIFDDGLATADGHWIEYNKAVAVLNARLGIRTTVICDRGFPHAAELEAMGVTVLALVERSPWRELVAGVSPFGPLKTLRYGWHFSRVLVTADAWLENFVEQQGTGLAVPDGDAAALAGAMADVARDFPAIRARAVERAGIALRINSAEPVARALWRPLA